MRGLMRQAGQAALSAALPGDGGAWPYGSLALVAVERAYRVSGFGRIHWLTDGGGWVLSAVDPEGCDLRCGATMARAVFDKAVSDAEQARVELVRLTKRARQITAEKTP